MAFFFQPDSFPSNGKRKIAENHTLISRALFDEGMRAVENKSYKKTVQKLALILASFGNNPDSIIPPSPVF